MKKADSNTWIAPSDFNINSRWISPSDFKNIVFEDPVVDWFNKHADEFGENYPEYKQDIIIAKNLSKDPKTFINSLLEKGKEFEKRVLDKLKGVFAHTEICSTREDLNNPLMFELKVEKTNQAMADGVEMILSGCVKNDELKIRGFPDIILRKDKLSKLVKYTPPLPKCKYVIIDIKYSTLAFAADNRHLLNSPQTLYYKTQVWIYTKCINKFGGDTAYILGKGWKCGDFRSYDCFDRLGEVNLKEKSLLNTLGVCQTKLNKIRDLKTLDPFCIELAPNMTNSYDFPWRCLKEKIAKKQGEITMLYGCGIKHRTNALKHGVSSLYDPKFDLQMLNLGPKTRKIVGRMLKLDKLDQLIYPSVAKDAIFLTNYTLEFFLDFETIYVETLDDLKSIIPKMVCPLIGLLCCVEGREPVYEYFLMKDTSADEQMFICQKMIDTIHEYIKSTGFKGAPPIWHWTGAEKTVWNTLIDRFDKGLRWDLEDNFMDLHAFIKERGIVFKNSLSFDLKTISKTLNPSTYSSNLTGIEASHTLNRYYSGLGVTPEEITTIINYNLDDCVNVRNILNTLRSFYGS